MNGTSIRALIESALQLMEANGMSPSRLQKYRTTGFGAIMRHFEQNGLDAYSSEEIDEFVYQLRQEYERGETTLRKWQLVRRSSELLKRFYDNGTLCMPPCTKWESIHNPLRCKPTEVELHENHNIRTLVWRVKNELMKIGVAEATIEIYQYYGFDPVLRAHFSHDLTQYSPELTKQLYDEARNSHNYKSIRTHTSKCQIARKTASLLEEFCSTGTLKWNRLSPCDLRELCDEYSKLLNCFCSGVRRTGIIKASFIPSVRGCYPGFSV